MQKISIFGALLLLLLNNYSNAQETSYEGACTIQSRIDYPEHYSLIKQVCDWQKFMQEKDQRNNEFSINNDKNLKIYEIKFVNNNNNKSSAITLKAGQLKNLNIKRLFMANISLESIEVGAFDGSGMSNYLEEIDLSSNLLKRLDQDILKNLKILKVLKLGKNTLQFEDSNFIHNEHLHEIDLSSNNLQFLPKKLFEGLKSLRKIDLSGNHLREISACHFHSQASDKKLKFLKIYEINVNLMDNQIECNCDLFYVDRKTNINLSVICNGPSYYKNKHLSKLKNENPECDHVKIANKCESIYQDHVDLVENNNAYRVATIILAILLIIVNIALIFACCHLCGLNDKLDLMSRNKKKHREPNSAYKKYEPLTNKSDKI